MQNISRACKIAGISRSHFYEIKEAFEKYGRDGLAPQPRRRPRMPNQTPPEIEQQIVAMTREYPTYSYVKIADQLNLIGVPAAASRFSAVQTNVALKLPAVVPRRGEGGEELVFFYRFPARQWKSLASTTVVERVTEEVRWRATTRGAASAGAVLLLRHGLVATGQLPLRRIAGWQCSHGPGTRPKASLQVTRHDPSRGFATAPLLGRVGWNCG